MGADRGARHILAHHSGDVSVAHLWRMLEEGELAKLEQDLRALLDVERRAGSAEGA